MYSQRDTKWKDLKINGTTSTLGNYGCFITCLAFLANITPDKALKKLEQAKAFNKDLIISDKAAKALGLEYYPPARSDSFNCSHTCIAEVDFNPETTAKEQHFVVLEPDGTQLDPWTGKTSKYRIISIRVFRNPLIENPMNKKVKEWAEAREKNQGLSTKEDWWQYAYDKKIKIDELEKDIEGFKSLVKEQKQVIEIQDETIEELEKDLASMQKPSKPMHEFKLFGFTFKLYK